MSEHKVIGYAASLSKGRFFAHGGAMLVAGEEKILRGCIESAYKRKSALEKYQIKKIRFWEIQLWLNNGTSVSFDEISYNRFAECTIEDGKKIKYQSFPPELKEKSHGIPIIKVTHK